MNPIILMQGLLYGNTPLIYSNYKKCGYRVIVSTYNKSDENLMGQIDMNDLVLSDEPENMGNYNRNGQRLTTYNGLKNINSIFPETLVLKTRTDHFFSNIDIVMKRFVYELKKHPVFAFDQIYRMIVPNAGTTATKIWGEYHISDHWMFGHIEDVIKYYTIDGVDLTKDYQIENHYSPEPEFCVLWMKNKKIEDTFENLLSKRFIILDNQELSYNVAKECDLYYCKTNWDAWIAGDNGTVTHKWWINSKKNIIFNF